MTQENPPVIENNEDNEETSVEQLDLMQEHTVAVDPKEMEKLDDLNREIAFRTSETAEAIREGQRKKGNEIERFDPTPVSTYEIPNKQAPTNRIKNWAIGVFGGLLSLGAVKESKGATPTDSLGKKSLTEKVTNPTDSVESTSVFDAKKYEQFGISRADLLESNDPTKDVLLVSIDEYKSYGDVFTILKKAGLKPSSTQTMDKVLSMNEDMFKRSGAVISLDEMVNKLGNPSYSTMTWDKKANSFHGESREVQVMKSNKKEEGSNFDSDYDRYRFIVEVPKNTTANYQSGIVKNK